MELTTGVENIVSVPSPNTGRRNVISNSSGKTKTDRVIRETKIGDVLPWEDIADEAERLLVISKASQNAANKVTTMEIRKTTKRWRRMKQTPTTRSFLGEGDLTL